MGMWFVDKRDGQMKYRPLGIAAMGPDPAVQGVIGPDGKPIAAMMILSTCSGFSIRMQEIF
jgi:hypothetical protein